MLMHSSLPLSTARRGQFSHRTNHSNENNAPRWIGVAVSGDNRPRPVTKGMLLFRGDPRLHRLGVIPMEDFVSLVAEVDQATPEILEGPSDNSGSAGARGERGTTHLVRRRACVQDDRRR